ncbi:MAG: hypothetical protein IIC93_10870 [Chloroflexi bacterium]|nr:hypothetical protein [Chloroflexota bacterium]
MTSQIPPPVVIPTQRLLAAERPKSAIPIIAIPFMLPFLLPFWAARFVYRKFTGYEPPPPQDVFVPDPEELAAAIDAICTGSGRAVDSTSDTCPVCDQGVDVTSGRLLTHNR